MAADLTDLKAHLNITGTGSDAELTFILSVATGIVANLAEDYVAVPEPTERLASLMIAARLWETQRGSTPTILQGGDNDVPFTPGLGGILTEVRSLLTASTRSSFGIA